MYLTIKEYTRKLSSGELTLEAALDAYCAAIEQDDGACFSSFDRQLVFRQLRELESRKAAGETLSPLAGVPVGLGSNICQKDLVCSANSKMLGGFAPPFDASVVEKLKQAGAIIMGSLSGDEFSCDGGSEITPASAVDKGLVLLAVASDTGGSLRGPASRLGLACLRPSYGLVSRHGLYAYSSSMDTISVCAKTSGDCALALKELAGQDARDSMTLSFEGAFDVNPLDTSKLRLASLEGDSGDASAKFKAAGAAVEDIQIDELKYALSAYLIIASAEASANMSRFDGVKYGFRAEDYSDLNELYFNSRSQGFTLALRERLGLGSLFLSSDFYKAYYDKALRARRILSDSLSAVFKSHDLIIAPAAGDPDTSKGLMGLEKANESFLLASLLGLPSLVVEGGSAQLIGRPGSEGLLTAAAAALN